MNRTDIAREQLTVLANDMTIELVVYDSEAWKALAILDPSNLHQPFGFLPPTPQSLSVSLDVIVNQCDYLSDDDFGHYLNALDVHICGHIEHWGKDDVEEIIDRNLYDLAAGSVSLMSEVQMKALDRCAK